MIRKEVEKLRGYLFTKDEMDEIIRPILNDSRNGKYAEEEKKPYKQFIKVEACTTHGPVLYDVPTKEEYEYFRENVSYYLERLGSRIAVLEEKKNSVPTTESPKKTFVSDKYQITFDDKGGFTFREEFVVGDRVGYNPDNKIPWFRQAYGDHRPTLSKNISGLELSKTTLEKLHEALELGNKQYLMDNEITFVK